VWRWFNSSCERPHRRLVRRPRARSKVFQLKLWRPAKYTWSRTAESEARASDTMVEWKSTRPVLIPNYLLKLSSSCTSVISRRCSAACLSEFAWLDCWPRAIEAEIRASGFKYSANYLPNTLEFTAPGAGSSHLPQTRLRTSGYREIPSCWWYWVFLDSLVHAWKHALLASGESCDSRRWWPANASNRLYSHFAHVSHIKIHRFIQLVGELFAPLRTGSESTAIPTMVILVLDLQPSPLICLTQGISPRWALRIRW